MIAFAIPTSNGVLTGEVNDQGECILALTETPEKSGKCAVWRTAIPLDLKAVRVLRDALSQVLEGGEEA